MGRNGAVFPAPHHPHAFNPFFSFHRIPPIPSGLPRAPAGGSKCPSNSLYLSLGERPRLSFTMRASPYSLISFSRAAWLILECARLTSTFLSCAFREQEDGQAAYPTI